MYRIRAGQDGDQITNKMLSKKFYYFIVISNLQDCIELNKSNQNNARIMKRINRSL